jgi:hypothetical protein
LIEVNGQTIAIVNDTSYSITTGKVQSRMRGAIAHMPQIRVGGVRMGTDRLTPYGFVTIKSVRTKWARERIADSLEKAAHASAQAQRARSNKDRRTTEALWWIQQAELVANLFKIKLPKINLDNLVEKHKKAIENEKRREREVQKQIEKDNEEKVQKWIRGEPDSYFPSAVSKVYLRVKALNTPGGAADGTIETSRGVSFPYEDGKRAFLFCMKMRERGWRRNGEQFKIGNYQLDAINSEGVVAGCHRVSWETIEAFAKQEGWM